MISPALLGPVLAWVLSAAPPGPDERLLGAAGYAKIVCSAVFVSGREVEEARRNSTYFLVRDADRASVAAVDVDRARGEVRVTLRDGRSRRARHAGDQGCVILPEDGLLHFRPVPVRSGLPPAASQPWPMGDAPDASPWPPDVDRRAVEEATTRAFADPEALTAAFLVVHRGRILAERYAPGIDRDTQLESWSMGKTVLATLMALLVNDGTYRLDEPAPVPAWHAPGDPRGAIRISDLLRMSSGLRCTSPFDPDRTPADGYPDHLLVYTGALDAHAFATSRPLQFAPGSEGRYRNCDPLAIGFLVEQAVRRRGEEILTFPQRALFDRIGIRRQVLETDPYGHFLLNGHDYGTARNWARLGLLWLRGGRWGGERLLPEGWTAFATAPAPAWRHAVYGAFVWLNRAGQLRLPIDAFYMLGAGGQYTIAVPSRDLVVVRMGHQRGEARAEDALNDALETLAAALPRVAPTGR
ncbi:MAG TPA: serine hydrolase [Anaeromyxobacteraceae bacterium]|nr:serine hydrolase [Anaeromyxobacteraceae bacterium]